MLCHSIGWLSHGYGLGLGLISIFDDFSVVERVGDDRAVILSYCAGLYDENSDL